MGGSLHPGDTAGSLSDVKLCRENGGGVHPGVPWRGWHVLGRVVGSKDPRLKKRGRGVSHQREKCGDMGVPSISKWREGGVPAQKKDRHPPPQQTCRGMVTPITTKGGPAPMCRFGTSQKQVSYVKHAPEKGGMGIPKVPLGGGMVD